MPQSMYAPALGWDTMPMGWLFGSRKRIHYRLKRRIHKRPTEGIMPGFAASPHEDIHPHTRDAMNASTASAKVKTAMMYGRLDKERGKEIYHQKLAAEMSAHRRAMLTQTDPNWKEQHARAWASAAYELGKLGNFESGTDPEMQFDPSVAPKLSGTTKSINKSSPSVIKPLSKVSKPLPKGDSQVFSLLSTPELMSRSANAIGEKAASANPGWSIHERAYKAHLRAAEANKHDRVKYRHHMDNAEAHLTAYHTQADGCAFAALHDWRAPGGKFIGKTKSEATSKALEAFVNMSPKQLQARPERTSVGDLAYSPHPYNSKKYEARKTQFTQGPAAKLLQKLKTGIKKLPPKLPAKKTKTPPKLPAKKG